MNSSMNEDIKLLFIIVDRKLTDKVLADLKENDAEFFQILYGKGTARSEILNLLGDNETERSIILCFVKEKHVSYVFDMLNTKYKFNKPGKGIAFTTSLKSISGPLALNIISKNI